jgi:hypothetical protein
MLPAPAIIVRKLNNNKPLDATHPKAASIPIPDILKDSILSLSLAEKVDQLEKKVEILFDQPHRHWMAVRAINLDE